MDKETLDKIAAIKWWHRIDLGDGVVTPGTSADSKLDYTRLPERMDGMRVLDIGAWDGWWSFLCERRGAKEVIALDTWKFDTGRRGFDLAKTILKSSVIPFQADIHDIRPGITLDGWASLGTFDLVLCLGVLHHLKSPVLALERIRSVCQGRLILETHLDLLDFRFPACAVYDGTDQPYPYGDSTCLWGPNGLAVEAWLRMAGFKSVEAVDIIPRAYAEGGERGAFHAS